MLLPFEIVKKSRNVGERGEPAIINKLIESKGKRVKGIGKIESVCDYKGQEYRNNITINEIQKAPAGAKRDVVINGKGYSLKTRARPAIVNHTTREKWIRICKKLRIPIDQLDDMISEYWKLRTSGDSGEDILACDERCPFVKTPKKRSYLKKLVTYFLFEGSGSKDSKYPADYILEFDDPSDVNTWQLFDKDSAFDSMWPKMVFSLRSKKGMPSNYPNMTDKKKKELIEPWVKKIDGDYRGALHIRVKR